MNEFTKFLISIFFLFFAWWVFLKVGKKYIAADLIPYSPELPNWVAIGASVVMILIHFGVIIFLGYA